jgi:hypothetical protein
MHGVGSDTLRSVHGGGVTQFGSGLDVVGGQGERAAVPYVPDSQATIPGQVEDDPAVAVFDLLGCGDTKSSVVGPSDDQVADAGGVAVG